MFLIFCLQFATAAQTAPLAQTTTTVTPATLTPAPTPSPTPNPKKFFYFPVVSNSSSDSPLPPPGTTPSYTSSVYMLSVDSTPVYNLGCQFGTIDRNFAGSRDTLVILDFGSPKIVNGQYGTDLFWMGPVTVTQIKSAVQNFSRGYYLCADGDRASQIYVGIGTTNYGSTLRSSTGTAYSHGAAWALMVNEVNAWLRTNGYSSQVHVIGAIDIELAWSTPATAKAWVNGYDSANLYDYYDFGTLDGCATRSDPNRNTCGNGWTREDAWYKAYGTRPAFPIPEIYNTRGANAQQWALLSLYSVNTKGYPIEFFGVMTQYQACVQAGMDQCLGVNNTPDQGWTQLYTELRKDSRTAYFPRWVTDIRWGYDLTADPGILSVQADLSSSAFPAPDQAARYRQALANPGLDPQMRASLVEKLAILEQHAADRAYGLAYPASKVAALAPAAPDAADPGFLTGIFEDGAGVAHAWEGRFTNHWQGIRNGEYVMVSAGSAAEDPSAGLVMVMRVSADRGQFTRQFVPAPQNAGALTVVAADGQTVSLVSETGVSFVFDVDSGSFR